MPRPSADRGATRSITVPVHDRKERIRRALESARPTLFEAIAGLTEEQMRRRPGPGRWSVAEVMAHLPVWEAHVLREAGSLREEAGRAITFPSQSERGEASGWRTAIPSPDSSASPQNDKR